jgi:hypothetical protein
VVVQVIQRTRAILFGGLLSNSWELHRMFRTLSTQRDMIQFTGSKLEPRTRAKDAKVKWQQRDARCDRTRQSRVRKAAQQLVLSQPASEAQ